MSLLVIAAAVIGSATPAGASSPSAGSVESGDTAAATGGAARALASALGIARAVALAGTVMRGDSAAGMLAIVGDASGATPSPSPSPSPELPTGALCDETAAVRSAWRTMSRIIALRVSDETVNSRAFTYWASSPDSPKL